MEGLVKNPAPLSSGSLVRPYMQKQEENSTGKALLLPGLELPDIEIEADENDDYGPNRKLEEWGYSEPVIEVNDYVLDMGVVDSFKLTYSLYSLPTFSFSINDPNYIVQKKLKNDKDICKIFIGYSDIYIKFKGLITNISGAKSSSRIKLSGILYGDNFYEQGQDLYNRLEEPYDYKVIEILYKYCTDLQLGLWRYDNPDLNFTPDIYIQPNIKRIDALADFIYKYTNNIWCIDAFGWLHIGNVESILANESDTYFFDTKRKEWYAPPYKQRKIKFVANRLHINEDDLEGNKDYRDTDEYYLIETKNVKVESNFSKNILYSHDEYILTDDNSDETKLNDMQIEFVSSNKKKENTFYGFSSLVQQKFPNRDERINKMLYGNYLTVTLEQPCYEIVPFTICELDMYIPSTTEDSEEYHLDEEHSKKHFVIGIEYSYSKNSSRDDVSKINQTLYLI